MISQDISVSAVADESPKKGETAPICFALFQLQEAWMFQVRVPYGEYDRSCQCGVASSVAPFDGSWLFWKGNNSLATVLDLTAIGWPSRTKASSSCVLTSGGYPAMTTQEG